MARQGAAWRGEARRGLARLLVKKTSLAHCVSKANLSVTDSNCKEKAWQKKVYWFSLARRVRRSN
jgi:hypothetical protein